jgi:hypothetical protein
MNWYDLLDSISFCPIFVDWTGSVNAALILSQLIYWSKRTTNPEGWVYKTAAQWEQETRLTKREQMRARGRLRECGLVEEKVKKANGSPTVHFRIVEERLRALVSEAAGNSDRRSLSAKVTKGNEPALLRKAKHKLQTRRNGAAPPLTEWEELIVFCANQLDKFLRTKRDLNGQQVPLPTWVKQLRWLLRDKLEGDAHRLKRVVRGYIKNSYEKKPTIDNAFQFKDKFFRIEDWLNRYEPPPAPQTIERVTVRRVEL